MRGQGADFALRISGFSLKRYNCFLTFGKGANDTFFLILLFYNDGKYLRGPYPAANGGPAGGVRGGDSPPAQSQNFQYN